MRRILAASVAVVALVVLAGCQPTEPTMTITTSAYRTPVCQDIESVNGNVEPAEATPKVVLQKSSGGKWSDWVGYSKAGGQAHTLTGTVNPNGSYAIAYMVPRTTNTIKMRVRSDGGGHFSDPFYVTPWTPQPGRCG